MKTRTITIYGMLICLAMLLSYVEAQLPAFFAVPGVKLGLTNIVVLCALYMLGRGAAIGVNLLRVLLVGLMFGNGMSLAYSAAGALLSGLTMILLQKRFHTVTVSVAGGLMHNVGQILVAMLVLETARLAWYLAVLWFSGMAAGAVIGIIGYELIHHLGPAVQRWKEGAEV